MLRSFLTHLEHDPAAARLADEGGEAFVSQSLRPFIVAALAARDARRPGLVVVGDDRAARDLAADLRAWLHPRPVRYYPSRGVAYESHLQPPPHLVGLRVAALDALTDTPEGSEQPVVVISAIALSEKVPDPKLRPHGFMLRTGDLIDLDETAQLLVAADEDVEPALRDHWEDVCTAFHDEEARSLYVSPSAIHGALLERAEARLSSISADQEIEIRGQAADFASRSLSEAEAELE